MNQHCSATYRASALFFADRLAGIRNISTS